MSEKQMDRFEGMLSQLISMVGHIREDVDMLKVDLSNVKADMNDMKADVILLKHKQEKQHIEVIGKLELLNMDHKITWTKTVENERAIDRLKAQFVEN